MRAVDSALLVRSDPSPMGRLITSAVPARSSSHCVVNYLIAAAAQFVDHLLAAVQRVNVDIVEVADSVIEPDAAHVTEPTLHYHGPDRLRLLRPRCEPRERQADTQFAAADVESGGRPATGAAADKRLDGEGPKSGRGADREVLGLAIHFWSAYGRSAVLDRAALLPNTAVRKETTPSCRSSRMRVQDAVSPSAGRPYAD